MLNFVIGFLLVAFGEFLGLLTSALLSANRDIKEETTKETNIKEEKENDNEL